MFPSLIFVFFERYKITNSMLAITINQLSLAYWDIGVVTDQLGSHFYL
jgi:hypothetical protein